MYLPGSNSNVTLVTVFCHLSLLFRYGIIDAMEDSYSSRPVVGRLVALDFRPARPLTLLGPLWAALCGVVASGGLAWKSQSLLILFFLFLLCDALLGAWRAIWLHADWRAALPRNLANARLWATLSDDTPAFFLRRLQRITSWRIKFIRTALWPLIDSELIGMLFAGALAMCIAVVLGLVPTILTGVALVIALVEGQAGAERGAGLRALFEIGFPWLIAQSAFGYFSWFSVTYILLFTLAYRALLGIAATRENRWLAWSNLTQLAVVFLLIAHNAPAGAGVVALGLLAQVLWQTRFRNDRDGHTYAQHIQSYILVGMLMASLSLWF